MFKNIATVPLASLLCTLPTTFTYVLSAKAHRLLTSVKQRKFRVKSENAKESEFQSKTNVQAYHLEPHDMK